MKSEHEGQLQILTKATEQLTKKLQNQKEFIKEMIQDLQNILPVLNQKLTSKQQEFVEVLLAIVMKHHSQLGQAANPFETVKLEQSSANQTVEK